MNVKRKNMALMAPISFQQNLSLKVFGNLTLSQLKLNEHEHSYGGKVPKEQKIDRDPKFAFGQWFCQFS